MTDLESSISANLNYISISTDINLRISIRMQHGPGTQKQAQDGMDQFRSHLYTGPWLSVCGCIPEGEEMSIAWVPFKLCHPHPNPGSSPTHPRCPMKNPCEQASPPKGHVSPPSGLLRKNEDGQTADGGERQGLGVIAFSGTAQSQRTEPWDTIHI